MGNSTTNSQNPKKEKGKVSQNGLTTTSTWIPKRNVQLGKSEMNQVSKGIRIDENRVAHEKDL